MKNKYFLDTNIIIYTFDSSNKSKQQKAQHLVEQALTNNIGHISYQVIQEFLNVATTKFLVPLSPLEAALYLEKVLIPLCDFYPSGDFYLFALEIKNYTKFSFYDSLIIAAAIRSNCDILYSEDLQDGQSIAGLTIKNPF